MMTMTQKILARHAGLEEVKAGQLIEARLDLVLGNDITTPVAITEFEKAGLTQVFDRDKIAIVLDHSTPCKDIKSAQLCAQARKFAKKYHITHFYDVGQAGIEHALLPEKGLTAPGEVIIGADSHTCTYGALGAFSTGVGSTDMAAGMATGLSWFKVPAAIKVTLKGKLAPYVSGKDVILHLIGMIGVDGALYKSLEFTGEGVAQLYGNPSHLRFSTELFPAVMQGENAPQSIIAALDEIAVRTDDFDCVVIIRGGGATGDLASFDNYDLAANVAQFPLPVIVGIGHERDVTILDYVVAVRVKTPTAAAEWLIGRMEAALTRVRDLAAEIFRAATSKVSGGLQQLAYYQGLLPSLSLGKIDRARSSLDAAVPEALRHAVELIVRRQNDRLDAASRLVEALSPQAVLRRGYSVCRVNGRAVTDASALNAGDILTTVLASGSIKSTVTEIEI